MHAQLLHLVFYSYVHQSPAQHPPAKWHMIPPLVCESLFVAVRSAPISSKYLLSRFHKQLLGFNVMKVDEIKTPNWWIPARDPHRPYIVSNLKIAGSKHSTAVVYMTSTVFSTSGLEPTMSQVTSFLRTKIIENNSTKWAPSPVISRVKSLHFWGYIPNLSFIFGHLYGPHKPI